jgi:murein DD-endopeptidase MepM/ murein hydrolase activator NlpD
LIKLHLMKRANFYKACLTLIPILSLAACVGIETTVEPMPEATISLILATSSSEDSVTATAPATQAPIKPTVQISPSPTVQSTVASGWPPCSPLADTPISELFEIISDPYHPPPMGKDERHQGVDFSYYRRGERLSIQGAGIQAVFAGRVAAAIHDSFPFGNNLILETPSTALPPEIRQHFNIQEGESIYILYAHMESPPDLELDQAVAACQPIGQVGKSGNAGVAHLHLEMRHGPAGTQFPSMAFYKPDDTPDERANYLLWATSGKFLHFDPMELLLFQK